MARDGQSPPSGQASYGAVAGSPDGEDAPALRARYEHGVESGFEDRSNSNNSNKYSRNSVQPLLSSRVASPLASPSHASERESWSWWRVGTIAVAATALSVAFSMSNLGRTSAAADSAMLGATSNGGSVDAGKPSQLAQQQQQQQQQQQRAGPTVMETEAAAEVAATSEELSFVAMNDYTRRGDIVGLGYSWLEGGMLVEPYRDTTLEVVSPREGMTYSWVVTGVEGAGRGGQVTLGEYVGEVVEVMFLKDPLYTIVLEERSSSAAVAGGAGAAGGGVTRSTSVDVFCRYVRREIRSLFDDERNEMFDAMKVLWDVSTDKGKVLYGEHYLDVWTIDMFHQVGASDINCDHLHDGIGFGITHSMVTMMFEGSLQLVNPKLSLPYWDFTIEGAKIEDDFDGDYSRLREASELWSPEWFGGVDPEDYQVKDGRWGYMEVPIVAQEHRDMLGADVYGRMRSPWNVNSREYLTRGLGEMCGEQSTDFYTWPGCSSHYDLQDVFTSYYGYTWWSQYGPHGPVHVWVGGNVDCKKDMDTVMDIVGEGWRLSLSGYLFVMRKGMFRDHLFKCEGYAEPDVTEEEIMKSGQCGCLDLNLEEGDDYIQVYEQFAEGYDFGFLTEGQKKTLAAQYCNGQVGMGESSQSSSPLDPTFWSMHPTMERLLVFKLMSGTFTDFSWPDEPGMWTGMDGVEYDVEISTEQDECYGHRGSDVFPYTILADLITPVFTFYGETGPNTISNREMIKMFDPSVNALPFIYDNFEWPHCAAQGYDFTDFYDPTTGRSGPKGMAATPEEKWRPGRVHGYGLFEKGQNHRSPMFAAASRAAADAAASEKAESKN